MLDTVPVDVGCPYCGEPITVLVDPSVADQQYVEDCSVCCRPISLTVTVDGDDVRVDARDENEV
ncbi:MAG: CPXCG motif-containing cysteine-rich protein [Pseudomonadales bacterium]